jgi:hypothetical protein
VTAQYVADVQIGALRSRLLIHDGTGHGTSLNLIWRDDEQPLDRAEQLLTQNGYQRTGAWIDHPGGFTATAEADEETRNCSCWLNTDGAVPYIEQVGHGCPDHRHLWERAS